MSADLGYYEKKGNASFASNTNGLEASSQNENLRSLEMLSEQSEESKATINRFIRRIL